MDTAAFQAAFGGAIATRPKGEPSKQVTSAFISIQVAFLLNFVKLCLECIKNKLNMAVCKATIVHPPGKFPRRIHVSLILTTE